MLRRCLAQTTEAQSGDFNVGIGHALLALADGDSSRCSAFLERLRLTTAKTLSITNTASLQQCHDIVLKFHALTEIEAISNLRETGNDEKSRLMKSLDQRLDVLGPFLSDKQFLLSLRRATMQLTT